MPFVSINPTTNESLRSYPAASDAETLNSLVTSQQAYRSWRSRSLEERAARLIRLAELLDQQVDSLAELITLEMGKRLVESRGEIRFCSTILKFYADQGPAFLEPRTLPNRSADVYLRLAPLGIILGIMPWNFPFYQVIRFAAPNLMVGNAVLVKHAESVPQCAERLQQLFEQAEFPKGLYQNLFLEIPQIASVIEDPRVQGVSLTGSERAGRAVAEQAGRQIKKSVLELGGNDAFIVLEDADLPATIKSAVHGRLRNTGQSCVASKRFIVVESVADNFLKGFREALTKVRVGDPRDEATQLGPLSTEAAAVRLDQQVQSAIKAGAEVLLGGRRVDRPGAFFEPTLLTGVKPGDPTFDQELFGPVATVYVVKDEAAAIELANQSSFGLGGSVYSNDLDRARAVAEQIETGMVFINEPTRSQASLPFGGIKRSGYGRELSTLAMEEFVNKQLIHLPKS